MSNINAPELGKGDHRRAKEATVVLDETLRAGEVILTTDNDEHDRYGRALARVSTLIEGEWLDAGELLIQRGLARPWY